SQLSRVAMKSGRGRRPGVARRHGGSNAADPSVRLWSRCVPVQQACDRPRLHEPVWRATLLPAPMSFRAGLLRDRLGTELDAPAQGTGVAIKRVERRVLVLATLQPAQSRACLLRPLRHVAEAQSLADPLAFEPANQAP